MSEPVPDPAARPPGPARGWAGLLVVVLILACVVAAVATALYLTGAYLTGP